MLKCSFPRLAEERKQPRVISDTYQDPTVRLRPSWDGSIRTGFFQTLGVRRLLCRNGGCGQQRDNRWHADTSTWTKFRATGGRAPCTMRPQAPLLRTKRRRTGFGCAWTLVTGFPSILAFLFASRPSGRDVSPHDRAPCTNRFVPRTPPGNERQRMDPGARRARFSLNVQTPVVPCYPESGSPQSR